MFKKIVLGMCAAVVLSVSAQAEQINAGAFILHGWGDKATAAKQGVIPDFWQETAAASGMSVQVNAYPYKRMIDQLKGGKDHYAVFFRSPASEQVADPVIKLYDVPVVIARPDGTPISSYEELANLKIVQPRGVFYDPRYDQDGSIQKVQTKDYVEAVKMAKAGRGDAVIGPLPTLKQQFAAQGMDASGLDSAYVLKVNEIWLQRSKAVATPAGEAQLTAAMTGLVDQGRFAALVDGYFQ